ncbi:class I SAM-dependent methyltransferase [Chloroflexi bacterium CFX6]|nr:class I SAM-dependent methyltransferase [Chloroflexi bacterium CFX6]
MVKRSGNMTEKISHTLDGVSETLLIPLYHRARESQRPDAMVRDDKAVEIVGKLDFDPSRFKMQKHDIIGLVCRVREFDRFARDFLTAHPDGVVVHIGCGLDTRFERVDNGRVEWYDLDLPEVIALRRKLVGDESGRYHLLPCSALDPAWIDLVKALYPRPFLFIAEGVLPYFEEAQVKWLVRTLHAAFPGAEMVFDAHTPWVVWGDNLQLKFSKISARLQFALKHGCDVEQWSPGIRMLEEWHYYGTDEPRVRPFRFMYTISFLRNSTGIFHYRLGSRRLT